MHGSLLRNFFLRSLRRIRPLHVYVDYVT